MHITKIKVNGFKSLVDFEMDLGKFTCLIGLNGSGKSTVLQFIDFLSQLVRGNMNEWLEERHWNDQDIRSKLTPLKKTFDFVVTLQDDNPSLSFQWRARYNIFERKCTSETFSMFIIPETGMAHADNLLAVDGQTLCLWHPENPDARVQERKIDFRYEGSVLSQIKIELLSKVFQLFVPFFYNLYSFDMLAPQSLRRRDRQSGGSIGLSGQRLSAFLHELGAKRRQELSQQLKQVYPHLKDVTTRSLKSGWKEMVVSEDYGDRMMLTEARHVNDGMLRLIAILAELESEHEFLLFDEIENGINPELVEFLIDILTRTQKQIMVTTHSPMILNYLNDETAQESVIYLYKTEEGKTRSIKFFDIPSLKEKLGVMGPGEVFVDTNLTELPDEIHSLFTETV